MCNQRTRVKQCRALQLGCRPLQVIHSEGMLLAPICLNLLERLSVCSCEQCAEGGLQDFNNVLRHASDREEPRVLSTVSFATHSHPFHMPARPHELHNRLFPCLGVFLGVVCGLLGSCPNLNTKGPNQLPSLKTAALHQLPNCVPLLDGNLCSNSLLNSIKVTCAEPAHIAPRLAQKK